MTWYHLALFAHICGVLLLFIADGVELTAMLGMRRARSVEQVREWTHVTERIDKVYPAAMLLILVAGVYMALTAWGIGIAWIDVAFVLLIALGVQGFALNAKRLHTIHVEAEGQSEGSISVSLAKRIHDPVLRSSAQIMPVITLGIVFLMTIKPNLVGSLLTIIIAVMVGALSVLPTWRSEYAESPATVVGEHVNEVGVH